MRKDEELIILLSRSKFSDNELSQIEELSKENLDWQYILKRSEMEGVSCFVYQHLKNLPFKNSIPEDILESFKNIYYTNSARNAFIYEGTKKLLEIFNAEKIKIVLLKGIFLAENIYKNVALRPMTDVDILVKKDDVIKVGDILNSLHYSMGVNGEAVLRQPFSYSLTFFPLNPNKEPNSFCIDVHWHILSSTWLMGFLSERIDMERIWQNAQTVRIDEVDTLTLSPPHLLLYLTQHAFSHSFDRLIVLTDILETLRHYKNRINWDILKEEAERLQLLDILDFSLCFIFQRLGMNLSEIEEDGLINQNFKKSIFCLFMNINTSVYGLPCLIYILLQKRLRDKLKFASKAISFFPYLMTHFKMRFRSLTGII